MVLSPVGGTGESKPVNQARLSWRAASIGEMQPTTLIFTFEERKRGREKCVYSFTQMSTVINYVTSLRLRPTRRLTVVPTEERKGPVGRPPITKEHESLLPTELRFARVPQKVASRQSRSSSDPRQLGSPQENQITNVSTTSTMKTPRYGFHPLRKCPPYYRYEPYEINSTCRYR